MDQELELSPHFSRRMIDRGFSEADLRVVMADATACRGDDQSIRFTIEAPFDTRRWHIVVEPDRQAKLLVVVTAYAVDRS